MAKNYLDIEASGELVKKSIEEICYIISQNGEESNGKYFQFYYDTETAHEDPLDAVSIKLVDIEIPEFPEIPDIPEIPEIPGINGERGQLLISNGEEWVENSNIYYMPFTTEENTILRLGPDLISNTTEEQRLKNSLIITGNSSASIDEPIWSTEGDSSRLDREDKTTYKMVLSNAAQATFQDKSNTFFGGEALTAIDEDSRLTLHGGKLDLTRGSSDEAPEVFIHGDSIIHIDNGEVFKENIIDSVKVIATADKQEYINNGLSLNGIEVNYEMPEGWESIEHLKAMGYTYGGATGSFPDEYTYRQETTYQLKETVFDKYSYDGEASMRGEHRTELILRDRGKIHVYEGGGLRLFGSSLLEASGDAKLKMDGNARFLCEDNADIKVSENSDIHINNAGVLRVQSQFDNKGSVVCINDGSAIIMNGDENGSPCLHCGNTEFNFCGTASYGAYVDRYNEKELPYVGSSGDLQIKIKNKTQIYCDGQGENYIKISSDSDKRVDLQYLGNCFTQMTGNAHSEIHDNSKFIMRGRYNAINSSRNPWNDGTSNGHNNDNWIRPIKPSDSPVIGMYDVAQFTMRGVWNYDEGPVSTTASIRFNDPTLTEINFTTISEMRENAPDTYELLKKARNSIEVMDWIDDNGTNQTQITSAVLSDGGFEIKVTKYKYSKIPYEWNAYLEKLEGQPVLEVIENSDVRIRGNSELKLTDYSIIANENGITFKDNTDEVTFSMTELKQLKALLTNSSIEGSD